MRHCRPPHAARITPFHGPLSINHKITVLQAAFAGRCHPVLPAGFIFFLIFLLLLQVASSALVVRFPQSVPLTPHPFHFVPKLKILAFSLKPLVD